MSDLSTHLATTHNQPQLADVTIIGGGLAGLIAANEAARQNMTVNLIERRPRFGGRASSNEREGFTLNQGPHAVYVGGHLHQALNRLRVDFTGAAPSENGEAIVQQRRGRIPQDPISMLRTKLLSTKAKPKLASTLLKIGRQDSSKLSTTTTEDWINNLSNDAEVRGLLKGIATLATYNSSLSTASADATAANLQLVLNDGVLYVHGGWQHIVDELISSVEASPLIRQSTGAATEVTAVDGTWRTSVGNDTFDSRTVVLAAGTPGTADRLFNTDTFTSNAGPKVTASILDLGLSQPPPTPALFDFDKALYLSLHSVADRLAPSQRSLVTLARYRRPNDPMSAKETEQLLVDHGTAAGIQSGQVVMRRYMHEMTVAHGTALATRGGLTGRPAVTVTGNPGAFIAGDWVGQSGLLADASAASALESIRGVASHIERSGRTSSLKQPQYD